MSLPIDKRELQTLIQDVLDHEPPFAPTAREIADVVVSHLLGATELPEPLRRENECGVDGAYWALRLATGFRGDWIQSYAIEGVPVVYDASGPDGMYSVEEMRERCLAGLAACVDAERLAAEQNVESASREGVAR